MKQERKNVKSRLYRLLTFFLCAIPLLNLVGNLIGISGLYTFYYYGYNGVAIASRFIENTIFSIGWRMFLLALTTIVASGTTYLLCRAARKGAILPMILFILLYIGDYLLVFSMSYNEGLLGSQISSFIHLFVLATCATLLLGAYLINPNRRGFYDYT